MILAVPEWSERAVILSGRSHGESAGLVSLLSEGQGRYLGLLRGYHGRHRRACAEPGTVVDARWYARLPEHLGVFTLEIERQAAVGLMYQPQRLTALMSMCALVEVALPERVPHPRIYLGCMALIDALAGPVWAAAYACWEMGFLREIGFGLDLARCAVTGATEDLRWISPRSGRAVSGSAGRPYAARLLPLSPLLVNKGDAAIADVLGALRATGYFLRCRMGPLPPVRNRLGEQFQSLIENEESIK